MKLRKSSCIVETALVVAGLLTGSPLKAGLVPLNAEFSLSAASSDAQAAPATASDPLGNTVAAFMRQGASTNGWDIFSRRFDSAGAPQGAEFPVNTLTAGCQQFPAVARAADGSFTITWSSENSDGSGFGIAARRFLADGTATGTEFGVNTSTAGDQLFPAIAMAPSGAFLISWEGSGSDVIARTFLANGTPASTEFSVPQTTSGSQVMPTATFSVSAAAPDRFWLAWSSLGQDGSGGGVYRRSFDLAGVALSAEALVPVASDSTQTRPRIAADASGNIVVAWEGVDSSESGVTARRFSAAGASLSGDVSINTTTAGAQGTPTVASLGEGDFAISWSSEGQDSEGSAAVILREFDHRQLAVGAEAIGNTSTAGDQGAPSAATGAGGPVFLAWQSDVAGALPTVLGRMYRHSGLDFFTVAPCRMLDTRNAAGPLGGPALVAGVVRNFPVLSACGMPASARALSLNITIVGASASGEVVIFPGDAPVPATSTVSFLAGVTRANNLVIAVSRNGAGTLNARPTLATDLVVDVNGYFE